MTDNQKVWSIIALLLSFAILVALSWFGYMYYQLGVVKDVLNDPGILLVVPERADMASSTATSTASTSPAAPLIAQ